MIRLLCKPFGSHGKVHEITPSSAGWRYVGFSLWRLRLGETVSEATGDREAILVMVEGRARLAAAGRDWGVLGERMNVFDKTPPHCLYLPSGAEWEAIAETECVIAVCSAPEKGGHEPRRIGPDGITLTERGKGANTRFINNIAMENEDYCDSLLVTEVFTPAGHWSSYPSHRHDEDDFPRITYQPRNDLGRPVFDGIEPVRAGEMARERGLRFIGLSEVYPFNDWNEDRRAAVAGLIETAQAAGAETVSFIPRVDNRRKDDGAERAKTLRAALAEILPILYGTGVIGLMEPIGFSTSSIKFQREATQAIEDLGVDDRLGIVHDTFQHALAGDPDIVVRHIRLVHISGIADGSGVLTDALDAQRVLIDETDRAGALGEVKSLLRAGYTGPFSYECTSPLVQNIGDPRAQIKASITYLSDLLGPR